MAIHHSTRTKAEKLGIMLTELPLDDSGEHAAIPNHPSATAPKGSVVAWWTEMNLKAYGTDGKTALQQAEALQAIRAVMQDCVIINDVHDPFLVRLFNADRTYTMNREPMLPTEALTEFKQEHNWLLTSVPEDGGEAHKANFPITDNPYPEDDEDNYARWDQEWEDSADAADAEGDEPEQGGSVVKSVFRLRYAELGHPSHCGDWLAVTLNNLILGKTHTDLEKFEALCAENGVDTSKYRRTGNGWQGRIRMTGRNLLARKIYLAGGVLKLTEELRTDPEVAGLIAPADWMAAQRYKMPKAEQGKAIPAPVQPTDEVTE